MIEFDEDSDSPLILRPSCVADIDTALDLNINAVELLDTWGSDLDIAAAAWTSTSINAQEISRKSPDRVPRLLKFLIENEHGTPFEQGGVRFRVLVDNPTHIQLLRHRTMSPNVESARYRPYKEAKCYVPPEAPPMVRAVRVADFEKTYDAYLGRVAHLTDTLQGGDGNLSKKQAHQRAKEIARLDLPQCLQVYMVVFFNLRAFQNFLYLRDHSHAQREIRELAQVMYALALKSGAFPYALPLLKAHTEARQRFTEGLDLGPVLDGILSNEVMV